MTRNIDEQVRQAMRAAADGIEPPVQELVDEGLARGRRLRRRHRMTTMAGGALTAAAIVAGATFLVPQVLSDRAAEDLEVATGGESEAEEDPASQLAEREPEMRAGEEARPALGDRGRRARRGPRSRLDRAHRTRVRSRGDADS